MTGKSSPPLQPPLLLPQPAFCWLPPPGEATPSLAGGAAADRVVTTGVPWLAIDAPTGDPAPLRLMPLRDAWLAPAGTSFGEDLLCLEEPGSVL